MPGSTVKAAAELTSRMWPRRLAISGSAACAVSIAPIRFTSIVRASARAEAVATVVSGAIPALATNNVQPAERVDRPLDGGLQRLGVGDVALDPEVLGPELVGHRGQQLGLET